MQPKIMIDTLYVVWWQHKYETKELQYLKLNKPALDSLLYMRNDI